MAWDDAGNLWWLKPQPNDFNPMQGIAAGMQMVQQNREQALRMKQLALQQQTRNDMLEWRNKQVDQEIRDYEFKKQQTQLEIDDMNTMGGVQSGKITNPTFKTPNGWKAYEAWQNTKSIVEYRQARQIQESKNAAEYERKLVKVLGSPSFKNEGEAVSFGQKKFGWTPDLAATVNDLYNQALEAGEIKEDVTTVGGIKGVYRNGQFFPLTQGLQHPETLLSPAQKSEIRIKESQIKELTKQRMEMLMEPGTPEWDAAEKQISGLMNQIKAIEATGPNSAPGAPATAPSGRVSVISPDGKRGTVPASQLDQALKMGYKQVQ